MGEIPIARCSKEDFDQILTELVDFWGSDRTAHLHHPIFLYQFGDTAHVIRDEGRVLAYLFGFVAQTGPMAYVHLVAVRRANRRQGLGRRLYEHFIEQTRGLGCRRLQAITTPGNLDSIRFHLSLGMEMLGRPGPDGIPVVPDYAGPGQPRVVFHRAI